MLRVSMPNALHRFLLFLYLSPVTKSCYLIDSDRVYCLRKLPQNNPLISLTSPCFGIIKRNMNHDYDNVIMNQSTLNLIIKLLNIATTNSDCPFSSTKIAYYIY